MTPAELAGGFALRTRMPLAGRIEESFRRRLDALPADTRRAAAGRGGRAGRRSGAAVAGGRAARLGARRRPRRSRPACWRSAPGFGSAIPLVRSAAYRSASLAGAPGACIAPWPRPPTRSSILTVAPGTGPRPRPGPTRRSPPSSSVRPAGRRPAAGRRGRRVPQRAVALTADPARRRSARWPRRRRASRPARSTRRWGSWPRPRPGRSTSSSAPEVDLLRGQIAFASGRGGDAPPLLLKAARRLEPFDPDLARETYLTRWGAAVVAGDLAGRASWRDLPRRPGPPSAPDARAPSTCCSTGLPC